MLLIFDQVFAPAVSEGAISIALALPRTGMSWRIPPLRSQRCPLSRTHPCVPPIHTLPALFVKSGSFKP